MLLGSVVTIKINWWIRKLFSNSQTLLLAPYDFNNNYQFPKRFTGNYHQKSIYSNYINNNIFHAFSVNDDS